MRHFLIVTGSILGNFILWAIYTLLPVHVMITFGLVVATGCLMIAVMVYFGGKREEAQPFNKQ